MDGWMDPFIQYIFIMVHKYNKKNIWSKGLNFRYHEWINQKKTPVNRKDSMLPYWSGRLLPIIPEADVWVWMSSSIPAASAAGIQKGTLVWGERPTLPSFWKLLLFELVCEALWCAVRSHGVRAEEHARFQCLLQQKQVFNEWGSANQVFQIQFPKGSL